MTTKEIQTHTYTHTYKRKHSCPIVATLSPLIGNLWIREGANEWEKKKERESDRRQGVPLPLTHRRPANFCSENKNGAHVCDKNKNKKQKQNLQHEWEVVVVAVVVGGVVVVVVWQPPPQEGRAVRCCEGGPPFELRQLECFSFSLQFFAAPTTQVAAACALSQRVSEKANVCWAHTHTPPQAH